MLDETKSTSEPDSVAEQEELAIILEILDEIERGYDETGAGVRAPALRDVPLQPRSGPPQLRQSRRRRGPAKPPLPSQNLKFSVTPTRLTETETPSHPPLARAISEGVSAALWTDVELIPVSRPEWAWVNEGMADEAAPRPRFRRQRARRQAEKSSLMNVIKRWRLRLAGEGGHADIIASLMLVGSALFLLSGSPSHTLTALRQAATNANAYLATGNDPRIYGSGARLLGHLHATAHEALDQELAHMFERPARAFWSPLDTALTRSDLGSGGR